MHMYVLAEFKCILFARTIAVSENFNGKRKLFVPRCKENISNSFPEQYGSLLLFSLETRCCTWVNVLMYTYTCILLGWLQLIIIIVLICKNYTINNTHRSACAILRCKIFWQLYLYTILVFKTYDKNIKWTFIHLIYFVEFINQMLSSAIYYTYSHRTHVVCDEIYYFIIKVLLHSNQ